MQFFVHKPPRKPGIEGSSCVIKTWQGDLYEVSYEVGKFYTLDGLGAYPENMIEWWCYKDSLIAHLEIEDCCYTGRKEE